MLQVWSSRGQGRAVASSVSSNCGRQTASCRRVVVAQSRSGRSSAGDGQRYNSRAKKEEVDERGWWEKPEERSMEAYQIQPLEPWQAEKLELAFALSGRRKMKVQVLAQELDLDRVSIINWAKTFAQRPAEEREPILARRRAEAEQERIKIEKLQVAAAAVHLQPHPETQPAGFIPFYTRKEMGMLEGHKRLPADVMRTLESIYSRTPFPSNDVIKGVWELHRLSRETVLEWFIRRREVDGITSSTQKRRERPRGGGASLFIEEDDGSLGAGPSGRGRGGEQGGEDVLMTLMGDVVPQPSAKEAAPQVYNMSKAEMAALRSSLPSRKKYKGRKLAEKMGIKLDDTDENALQIGDMRFVEDSSGQQATKWTQAWRFKQATSSVNVKRVKPGSEDEP